MGGTWQTRLVLLLALSTLFISTRAAPIIKPPKAAPPPTAGDGPGNVGSAYAPAPGPAADEWPPCEGIEVLYESTFTKKIYPYLNDTPWIQPYHFEATATLTNMGYSTCQNWAMGIKYQHHEILVSAGPAELENGMLMPVDVSNGTVLTASPPEDLMNAIETAGDLTKIRKIIPIVGTEFGVKLDPMPLSINITNEGYNCSGPTIKGNNTMHVCCLEQSHNITLNDDDKILPSEKGNITITYDITQAYQNNYMALVTISNDMVVQRIDHWNLSWTWQEGEFINQIKGAQTAESDIDVCINGVAGITYSAGPDVNLAASCSKSPEILDLPVAETNNTNLGGIKYCCKNGTIFPAIIDPSETKSAFIMNVYKVPPGDTEITHLVPPSNFKIMQDGLYNCSVPRLIEPSTYTDPYETPGILHLTSAVKTWQVTCNVTTVKEPKMCCVSFSAYYNESIVPCPTCACGCPAAPDPVCNANASAALLPYGALTLAPVNRTKQIVAWAGLNHKVLPNPLPCEDYCGVAINWHIVSDFNKGWSARMTLLDWSNITYPDWYAVVEIPKAFAGLQKAYSFNATKVPLTNATKDYNNTFILQGLPGLNYLIAEQNLTSGKLQSVISFTKSSTPGLEIPLGDGFPTKIWFNGDECVLPNYIPLNTARQLAPTALTFMAVVISCFVMLGPYGL